MRVRVKLTNDEYVPIYATDGASGLDLFAIEDAYIRRDPVMVPTGVRIEIPEGYEGQIRPRSSLSKRGILVHFGTIDSDYRGEIGVTIQALSDYVHLIAGDRIAQLVICPVERVWLDPVDELSVTARGIRGYGSTGR